MPDGSHRPRVAISSCLLGEPVRYDGKHKHCQCVTDVLSDCFDWFPVCPEVAIGMGVPRPPVRLVMRGDGVHACGVEMAELEVTASLRAYARELAATLTGTSGYIFKSRSPSCGVDDADLFNVENELIGKSAGIFSAMIHDLLPDLPLIDEIALEEQVVREAFVQQVRDYHAMRQDRK